MDVVLGVAADCASGGSNQASTVTYAAAGHGLAHAVGLITWSYKGGDPTGRLTVQDGASTIFDIDIAREGPGQIICGKKGTTNTALTVTLGAGGSGVSSKVVVSHWIVQ
jgi:hypothetical protein